MVKEYMYENFNKYSKLPKLSNTSKLLQELYDNVCNSSLGICNITEEEWKQNYNKRYSDKDITELEKEVKKYKLSDVLVINNQKFKIRAYGNLKNSFNDDRTIQKNKDIER